MLRELLTFVCVGGAVTLAHIVVAIVIEGSLRTTPQIANLCGYVAAVGLSYFGHGLLTFRVTTNHRRHLPKFIGVSLFGLVVGSLMVDILAVRIGVAFPLTMLCVGGAVALSTFILSKFWAFAQKS